ncbi:hypothetical protein PV773_04540 [Mesorhizobium sp. CC13]|uniref:hypothetical protein n=1 Tax=Mesorhizobium sp. CC13 TaxID=3029194 RepID=UPI00326712AB
MQVDGPTSGAAAFAPASAVSQSRVAGRAENLVAATATRAERSAGSSTSALDDAHRTALSALRNERFGLVMERLADVRISDALAVMRPVEGAGTDTRSALARYDENS